MPDETAKTMAEATGKPVGPALSATSDMPEAPPEAPPLSEEIKPADQPEAAGAETEPEQQQTEEPVKKPKPGIQERFSEYAAKVRSLEERATKAESALVEAVSVIGKSTSQGSPQRAATQAVVDDALKDTRPQRLAYDNPDAYESDLIAWSSRQATRQATAETEHKRLEAENTARNQRYQKSYHESRTKAIERYADFELVAESPDVQISQNVGFAIISMGDAGRDVQYHLGKHPDEAARISALEPAAQLIELGKISASLGKEPVVSKAGRPIKPLGSRGTATHKSPDEEPMEEYAARRNAERRAEWRRVHGTSGQRPN